MLPYEALAYALPENILTLKYSGRFEDELRLIDEYLGRQIPDTLRRALLCEKFLAQTLPGEYTLSFDEALAELRAVRPDFKAETLRKMMDDGRAEWRMVNCEPAHGLPPGADKHSGSPKPDADSGGKRDRQNHPRDEGNGSYAVGLVDINFDNDGAVGRERRFAPGCRCRYRRMRSRRLRFPPTASSHRRTARRERLISICRIGRDLNFR